VHADSPNLGRPKPESRTQWSILKRGYPGTQILLILRVPHIAPLYSLPGHSFFRKCYKHSQMSPLTMMSPVVSARTDTVRIKRRLPSSSPKKVVLENTIWCIIYLIAPNLQPWTLCLTLLRTLHSTHPLTSILDINLPPRPQLRLMQIEIIHRANPHNLYLREPFANTIHERTARFAEIIRHHLTARNGFRLSECC
jgi:hypothetical protein